MMNTRVSIRREGRRSSRRWGGGAAALRAPCVAVKALLTMAAQEEGEKSAEMAERTPSCRRRARASAPPLAAASTGALPSAAGGYAMPPTPALSPMGGAPHCTRRKSTEAAPGAATGPPARVSHASVAYDSVSVGGGCKAITAGGSCMARKGGRAPPSSGAGSVAPHCGSGAPMVMLQLPTREVATLPTGTRTMESATAGAQLGGAR